jgi:very-short-patch-repair endonuclease
MALLGKTIPTGFYFGASTEIIERAKELRKSMTAAENYLWQQLRRNNMNDYRFRRQHPIWRFIVDFYCHSEKLVIEIDGDIHETADQRERDENRTFELEKRGLRVVRFSNRQVLEENELVLKTIWLHLQETNKNCTSKQ